MNISDIQKAKKTTLLSISLVTWSLLAYDSPVSPLPSQKAIALLVVVFKDKTCTEITFQTVDTTAFTRATAVYLKKMIHHFNYTSHYF